MKLGKRERSIGLALLALTAFLAADRFLLSPALSARRELLARQREIIAETGRARRLVERWRETSLERPEITTGDTLAAIEEWARESRLSISLLRPEQSSGAGSSPENTYQVNGTGTLAQVTGFLALAEGSHRALKVKDLLVTSRSENTDELSFRMRLGEIRPSFPVPTAGGNHGKESG